jgi:hypothetical protein
MRMVLHGSMQPVIPISIASPIVLGLSAYDGIVNSRVISISRSLAIFASTSLVGYLGYLGAV